MIKDILALIDLGGQKIITIISLVIAIYLVVYFKKHLFKRFEGFEANMSTWSNSIEFHMKETRTALSSHTDSMGKATKAINGDMLKIRENVFELKQEIIIKIEDLKTFTSQLLRDTEILAHHLELTTQKFDDKFGRIIEFRETLNHLHGQVTQLDELTGKFKIMHAGHLRNISDISKVLKNQKEEIETIKKSQHSNKG